MEKKVYWLKAVTFFSLRVLMYVITERLATSGFAWEDGKQGNYDRKEAQMMEKEQNQYCILVEELLPLYQEGSLGEIAAKSIKDHLKQCSSCREKNGQLAAIRKKMDHSGKAGLSQEESRERGKFLTVSKRLRKRRLRNGIMGGLICFCLFCLYQTCFWTTIMDGVSMEPVIHSGDTCIISRIAYIAASPKRDDIVMMQWQEGGEHWTDIYRIAGIPGDQVRIADGHLTVNGKQVERYEGIGIKGAYQDDQRSYSFTVPENQYFFLGDNYEVSLDSRSLGFACVDRKNIMGKYLGVSKLPSLGVTSSVSVSSEKP